MYISEWLNTTNVYNKDILVKALDHRPQNVPLITVSNHHSCFDDPGLWGNYVLLQWCLNLLLYKNNALHTLFKIYFPSYSGPQTLMQS